MHVWRARESPPPRKMPTQLHSDRVFYQTNEPEDETTSYPLTDPQNDYKLIQRC